MFLPLNHNACNEQPQQILPLSEVGVFVGFYFEEEIINRGEEKVGERRGEERRALAK